MMGESREEGSTRPREEERKWNGNKWNGTIK